MPSQAYELARKLEMEKYFHQTISFTQFAEKTAPKTVGTNLPQLAQSLVNRISTFCQPDENGSFGIIRGGSMRSFLFNNYATDERFAEVFSEVDQILLGSDPLAGQVINKVFSLPKDVDVFLHSKLPNSQVHKEDILFQNIIGELEVQGYAKQSENENKMIFFNGRYQVHVLKHTTGKNHPQTLVKVDVSEGDQVLMKLHFGLIPDENERKSDPRFFEETADIEREATGSLTKGINGKISVDYLGFKGTPDAVLFMREKTHFFDPILHHFIVKPEKNPDQVISSRLREINFRVALFDWIKEFDPQIRDQPYYELFIKFGMNYEGRRLEGENGQMIQWFHKYRDDIKDHFKLTASDVVYGLTVNPFLFFLFAFSTHILDAFPLGEKIAEFEPLRHYLEWLAEEVGGSLTDSLLILSHKYNQSLKKPSDTAIYKMMKFLKEPETISAFLKFINPLLKKPQEESIDHAVTTSEVV